MVELPIAQAARSADGFKARIDWSTVRIDVVGVTITDGNGIAAHVPVVDGDVTKTNRLAIPGTSDFLFAAPGLVVRRVDPIANLSTLLELRRQAQQTIQFATRGRTSNQTAHTTVHTPTVSDDPMFVLDGTPARFDTARTIRIRIMAADTMERIMTHLVEIDLEPIGCMDPAASRVACVGGDGRDLSQCANARTTASNVTDETAGTFANPQGNFDARIRVPLGACRYPPTVAARGEPVSVAAPSFKRPEEVTNPDEVRGSFKLAVPTGATGTQAALEASEPDDTIRNMVSVASSSSSSSPI